MNFAEAVTYLLGLGHETLAIKLGLKNTELLLEALNNPQRNFAAVQIAGTNGKGSTAVFLDSICRAAGIKTGLYTSPHLVSITERIEINGTELKDEQFAHHATTVRNAAEKLLAQGKIQALPTFFEQVTAIAFLAFQRSQIDLAVLETGLGGRLDSTSVARAQTVGITQIAMDHEEYLGSTIASIAAEKAAIIRPGSSVVIADRQPVEALEVIKRECEKHGVTPKLGACRNVIEETTSDGRFCVTFETEFATYERVWLGLRGRHQIDNVAVAIQLAESLRKTGFSIPHSAIFEGVSAARHPARLELIRGKPVFLLDGAHNPGGARALREYLDNFAMRPLTVIFGGMRDKRLSEIAQILLTVADSVVLTPVNNPRAAPVELLREIAEQHLSSNQIRVASSSVDALETAIALTPPVGMVCVTGSLYLIGETRPAILRRFVSDSFSLS
jgi:dihydrofolate synthase / folylpolyglutamate synthase